MSWLLESSEKVNDHQAKSLIQEGYYLSNEEESGHKLKSLDAHDISKNSDNAVVAVERISIRSHTPK